MLRLKMQNIGSFVIQKQTIIQLGQGEVNCVTRQGFSRATVFQITSHLGPFSLSMLGIGPGRDLLHVKNVLCHRAAAAALFLSHHQLIRERIMNRGPQSQIER